jgi:hypothetical protein
MSRTAYYVLLTTHHQRLFGHGNPNCSIYCLLTLDVLLGMAGQKFYVSHNYSGMQRFTLYLQKYISCVPLDFKLSPSGTYFPPETLPHKIEADKKKEEFFFVLCLRY